MSKYTTQLRWIIETLAPGITGIKDQIETARPLIFDFDYPCWENGKPDLETAILRHFYTQEIGFETVALWKFNLEMILNEIMPKYKALWETTIEKYDYLNNIDVTEEINGETSGSYNREESTRQTGINESDSRSNEEVTADNTGTNNQLFSDFPQVKLEGVYDKDYANREELTNTSSNATSSSTANSNSTSNLTNTVNASHTDRRQDTDNRTHKRKGFIGSSRPQLIKEYRETFLEIPRMIIADLQPLFMGLW